MIGSKEEVFIREAGRGSFFLNRLKGGFFSKT